MSEPRARYVGWDPGKQPVKSNERKLKDLYNGSISQVEHQSQAIRAQKPSFVAAAARLAAAKAQPHGSSSNAQLQPQQMTQSVSRPQPAKQIRTHMRRNSASAAAAAMAAPAIKPPLSPTPETTQTRSNPNAKFSNGTVLTKPPNLDTSRARKPGGSGGPTTPTTPGLRLSLTDTTLDSTSLARNAASAALTETSPRLSRRRNSSMSSISSASLLAVSPMPPLGQESQSHAAGAATVALRSRQPSIIGDLDYEASFTARDRGEASTAAMLAAPLSLGQTFSETAVGVPTAHEHMLSMATTASTHEGAESLYSSALELPLHASQACQPRLTSPVSSQIPQSPKSPKLTAQASAAARASSLKPIQVAPREPLSVKFVSSLSASLKSQSESKAATEDTTLRRKDTLFEKTAARISASREHELHDAASVSSAGTNSQTARSALAAAVRATPLAENEVARIQEVVAAKSRRKKRFKPSGQWSGGSVNLIAPRPLSFNGERPLLASRWSTSTAPHSLRQDTPPPPESGTASSSQTSSGAANSSSTVLSPSKKHNFFSRLFRKGDKASQSDTSLLTLENTPSPVQQPAPPPKKHLKQTMRDGHISKKKIFNEEKPWKHHLEAHVISEKERKRYERVWAANKGSHVPFLPSIVEAETNGGLPAGLGDPEGYRSSQSLLSTASAPVPPSLMPPPSSTAPLAIPGTAAVAANTATTNAAMALSPAVSSFGAPGRQSFDGRSIQSGDTLELYERQQLEDIHGYVVAQLWRRSHLSDDVLAQVWELVDNNQDGTLDRSSFIVGMWLVDQCLYGRKLPARVDESVWKSVGHLQVKVRVKNPRKKLLRVKYLRHRKRTSAATSVDPYLLLSQPAELPQNTSVDV